jgi:hypothetical protein
MNAWEAYTPTNTNVTVGNGTLVARYIRIGRTIHFFWDLTFGSTTAFGGTISIGLPLAAATPGRWAIAGTLLDSGTQNYIAGGIIAAAATQANPLVTAGGGITSTAPFTWTTGDRIAFSGTYEAAS